MIKSKGLYFDDLRIISGKYRSRKFFRPRAEITRPLLARSRLSVLNVLLSKYPDGFRFTVDCFAGSGAFSLELVSREMVDKLLMVDLSNEAVDVLKKNVSILDNEDSVKCQIECNDIFKIIENGKCKDADLFFLDPPYSMTFEICNQLLQDINPNTVNNQPIVIIVYDGKMKCDLQIPDYFTEIDKRNYGRNNFLFLQMK